MTEDRAWVLLKSGRRLDLLNPHPHAWNDDDIATGLARTYRWGGHWAIENSLHRGLDVTFGDDQSRLRKGYGAKSMAVVRHFALNLVQAAKNEHSIHLRRKLATWTPAYLEHLLNADAK